LILIAAVAAVLIASTGWAIGLVIAHQQGYSALAWSAAAILALVLLVSAFVTRVRISSLSGTPWLIAGVSLAASLVPWWLVASGRGEIGALLYQGLRIPQGIVQFWDLALVLESVDCARWGFDIYEVGNGCLAEPSIYAPGMVWLQYVPGGIFSESNAGWLGVAMIVISSLALLLLARWSTGVGRIVLLISAVGAPWVLLLERGNVDAVVLWVAVITVALAHRFNSLTKWTVAALLIWIVGTWKYYPFALGLLLLPALTIRRGWTVIAGFAAATLAYIALTWEGFQTSRAASSAMVDFGDFVVLGRTPVVARMLGHGDAIGSWQAGDTLMALIGLLAVLLGALVAWRSRVRNPILGALAAGGGALYLSVVLVAGFGYGYKATFLLLAVPYLSAWPGSKGRLLVAVGLAALLLIGIESVVVWNTVLATTAGIIAAGIALGAGGASVLRSYQQARSAQSSATTLPS